MSSARTSALTKTSAMASTIERILRSYSQKGTLFARPGPCGADVLGGGCATADGAALTTTGALDALGCGLTIGLVAAGFGALGAVDAEGVEAIDPRGATKVAAVAGGSAACSGAL